MPTALRGHVLQSMPTPAVGMAPDQQSAGDLQFIGIAKWSIRGMGSALVDGLNRTPTF
jgi:hypothetical protein